MMWAVSTINGRHHVTPLNDLRPHEGCDCWCRPFDDGEVVVHNSMDRRELVESGEIKLH